MHARDHASSILSHAPLWSMQWGNTFLAWCCSFKKTTLVHELLRCGADPRVGALNKKPLDICM